MNILIEGILEKAVLIAKNGVNQQGIKYSSNSSVNEEYMVDCLKEAAILQGVDPGIIEHVKGHAFPDVIIKGSSIGIELKGAKTGMSFNGNSVVGSTFVEGVKKVYLYYWIDDLKLFGFRDYFESVISPVVTHSPRFRLKIDLKKGEGMFGLEAGQIGLAEDIVFSPNGIDSDKIINWMRDKAQSSGQAAWWMGERSYVSDLPVSTGLRIGKNELTNVEKREILEKGFLYFPELLSSRMDKFNSFISWGISMYSVVLNRDFYTAGGRISCSSEEDVVFFSQIYKKYLIFLDNIQQVTLSKDDLKMAYGFDIEDIDHFYKVYWSKLISNFDENNVKNRNDEGIGKYHIKNLEIAVKDIIFRHVLLL